VGVRYGGLFTGSVLTRHKGYFAFILIFGLIVGLPFSLLQVSHAAHTVGYEVWVLDQSDTSAEGGGTLYIYHGSSFGGKGYKGTPEVINFADSAGGIGDGVGKRPHMIFFNSEQSHSIIANVSTGHIYIMDADTREILSSIRMGKDGDQMRGAHAAVPAPDSSMLIVTNHKKLERMHTDYANNEYSYNPDDALNLADLEDETHPDNWIVCPLFTEDSRFVFTTVRGGGLYVIDVKSTPMKIVASFDNDQVKPNGCGGVIDNKESRMYINSGGGTANHPLGSDVYVFELSGLSADPPTVSEPQNILSREGFVDSHGMLLTKNDRYLWTTDRAANLIEVIDVRTDEVVNQIDLTKGSADLDPAPDLIFASPHRTVAFAALRGPSPLTANAPDVNNAVGNSPGVAVIKMSSHGKTGNLLYIIPISNVVDGKETADPHGIAVRELA
jgi:DNA-binding beta-propeller fold protein YncE